MQMMRITRIKNLRHRAPILLAEVRHGNLLQDRRQIPSIFAAVQKCPVSRCWKYPISIFRTLSMVN